jgi:hypothetical protein
MSGSNPDVKFSIVFPTYYSNQRDQDGEDMELTQGDTMRAIVGLQNNHNASIYIRSITGAFVDSFGDSETFVQNFTVDSFNHQEVKQKDSLSIATEFFPFTSISAKQYKLLLVVFYSDSEYEYSNVVYN